MNRVSTAVISGLLVLALGPVLCFSSAQAATSGRKRGAEPRDSIDSMQRAALLQGAVASGAFSAPDVRPPAAVASSVADAEAGMGAAGTLAQPDDDIPGVYLPQVPHNDTVNADTDPHDVYCFFGEWEEHAVVDLITESGELATMRLGLSGATSVYDSNWSLLGPHLEFWSAVPGYRYIDIRAGRYWGEPARDMAYTIDATYNSIDDQIPGLPPHLIPRQPVVDWYDSYCTGDDVYQVQLYPGDRITARLVQDVEYVTADIDLDLFLYGPEAIDVTTDPFLVGSEGPDGNELLSYTAPTAGIYYLNVWAVQGGGLASLTWEITRGEVTTVYRFYNRSNGSHFYTPSAEERDAVIARWPGVYSYEGAAYSLATRLNDAPLYRFYNHGNGSHFYTASAEEANTVRARWPSVYTFEGPTYSVCTQERPGTTPVYRFYNRKSASHFYTTSPEERDMVVSRWPDTFSLEGVAFWVAK